MAQQESHSSHRLPFLPGPRTCHATCISCLAFPHSLRRRLQDDGHPASQPPGAFTALACYHRGFQAGSWAACMTQAAPGQTGQGSCGLKNARPWAAPCGHTAACHPQLAQSTGSEETPGSRPRDAAQGQAQEGRRNVHTFSTHGGVPRVHSTANTPQQRAIQPTQPKERSDTPPSDQGQGTAQDPSRQRPDRLCPGQL